MTIKINDWVEATISLPSKKFTQQTGKENILIITGEVEEITEQYLILHTGEVISHTNPNTTIKILKNVTSLPKGIHFKE